MFKIRFQTLMALLLPFTFLQAQEALTYDKALKTALSNNYGILILKNDASIAKNNNSPGNAGFLPKVSLDGTFTNSSNSTHQEYFNGNIKDADNAKSFSVNAGASLNWTLFDGMQMFVLADKFNRLEELTDIQVRAAAENLIASVTALYFNIVQQTKLNEVLKNSLAFSNKRYEFIKAKYELGSATELALLQARIDLNTDSAACLKQEFLLRNSKAELNRLMVTEMDTGYELADSLFPLPVFTYEELVKAAVQGSTGLLGADLDKRISLLDTRLSKAPAYPRLDFFAEYNYVKSKSDVGILESNLNNGTSYGLTLSMNIFDGFNRRREIKNARLQAENSSLKYEQLLRDTRINISQAYNDYLLSLQMIRFGKQNLEAARKNTFIAFEQYKLGGISDLDLRQIQLTELENESQLILYQYENKLLETDLLRMAGKLVSDNL